MNSVGCRNDGALEQAVLSPGASHQKTVPLLPLLARAHSARSQRGVRADSEPRQLAAAACAKALLGLTLRYDPACVVDQLLSSGQRNRSWRSDDTDPFLADRPGRRLEGAFAALWSRLECARLPACGCARRVSGPLLLSLVPDVGCKLPIVSNLLPYDDSRRQAQRKSRRDYCDPRSPGSVFRGAQTVYLLASAFDPCER